MNRTLRLGLLVVVTLVRGLAGEADPTAYCGDRAEDQGILSTDSRPARAPVALRRMPAFPGPAGRAAGRGVRRKGAVPRDSGRPLAKGAKAFGAGLRRFRG